MSIRKRMKYLLVILSVSLGVVSQMLLKKSAQTDYAVWWREYLNGWVVSGYALMVVSLLINLFAIHLGVLAQEVSIIESLSYLLIPTAAWLIYKEPITKRRLVAILIIMLGAIIFFLHPNGWWGMRL